MVPFGPEPIYRNCDVLGPVVDEGLGTEYGDRMVCQVHHSMVFYVERRRRIFGHGHGHIAGETVWTVVLAGDSRPVLLPDFASSCSMVSCLELGMLLDVKPL